MEAAGWWKLPGISESTKICFTTGAGKYLDDTVHAFPGKGHLKPPDEELRRLKKELTDVTKRSATSFKKPWPSSQSTPDEVFLHRRAPLRVQGEEDVPCIGYLKEQVLRMEKAFRGTQATMRTKAFSKRSKKPIK
jgi:hypothetical protein